MAIMYTNTFVCPNCGYTETYDANEPRWRLEVEYLQEGNTDEQYGLYKCHCGTESWSFVEAYENDDDESCE